jgi:hypothetical protein
MYLILCNLFHLPYFFSTSQYFEPTSDHKCLLPLKNEISVESGGNEKQPLLNGLKFINFIKPNLSELICMIKYAVHVKLITPTDEILGLLGI